MNSGKNKSIGKRQRQNYCCRSHVTRWSASIVEKSRQSVSNRRRKSVSESKAIGGQQDAPEHTHEEPKRRLLYYPRARTPTCKHERDSKDLDMYNSKGPTYYYCSEAELSRAQRYNWS
jgi:hypothetical protein